MRAAPRDAQELREVAQRNVANARFAAFEGALADYAAEVADGKVPRGDAVDELLDLARAHGHFGRDEDEITEIISHGIDEVRAHGKANGGRSDDQRFPEIDVRGWHGQPVPEREWTVLNRIIRRNVALLSGPGGIGKSILILQLAVAHVLGRDWLGTMPVPGPVIYLNAEDDADELHRRLDAVLAHYGAGFDALGDFHLTALAGQAAVLGEADRHGVVRPTRLFQQLYEHACAIRPVLVALDTAADMFAGDENNRAQVRQFIGLLRMIAVAADCAVLLASHPSVYGMEKGTGTSGSTAWNNSVRTRLYFQPQNKSNGDDADDTDLRELQCMKSNYGPTGEIVRLRWANGVFKPIASPSSLERAAADEKAEEMFLQLFDRLTAQGQTLSHLKTSPNYAPRSFAELRDAKGTAADTFAAAMQRLLDAGRLRVETYGKPSRPYARLVRT
jgi:RecA-family ATPase